MKKEYDFSNGRRGPVIPPAPNKTRITIRLDNDILEWFKGKVHQAGGGSYQTLINDALHKHVTSEKEPIEEILRRVIREEINEKNFVHA